MAEIRMDAALKPVSDTDAVTKADTFMEAESDAAPEFSGMLRPGLYIVATPIGNLGDISPRALKVLASVDIIACEDTRVTAKLLAAKGLRAKMIAYHEHNGPQQRPKILAAIDGGKAIALVSDAGTPLISDPGYKLVAEVAEAGHYITSLPGPSALTTALTLAGLPTDKILFLGFAPNKSAARQSWFDAEKNQDATLVFYESARRASASIQDAATVLGPRSAAICREMTKHYEEVLRGSLAELAETLEARRDTLKGEIVVVVEGAPPKAANTGSDDSEKLLEAALKHMSVKSAAAFVSEITGQRKKDMYQQALALQKDA